MKNVRNAILLLLGLCSLLLLNVLAGYVTMNQIDGIEQSTTALVNDRYPKVMALNAIQTDLNISAEALRGLLLAADSADQDREAERLTRAATDGDALLHEIGARLTDADSKKLFDKVVHARGAYLTSMIRVSDRLADGQLGLARESMLKLLKEEQSDYFHAIEDLAAFQNASMEAVVKRARRNILIIKALFTEFAFLSLVLAVLVSRKLVKLKLNRP